MRDAGRFAEWVVAMQAGMRTGEGTEVPCDGCVACCTSGQEIAVEDDEVNALPEGAVVDGVLARDGTGCCVLLVDGACAAYEQRPRRCRTYDCRIFPATGLMPETDKPAIAERAATWRFRYETVSDRERQEAVRVAVVTLRARQLGRPPSTTQLAAAAIQLHDELLESAPQGGNRPHR